MKQVQFQNTKDADNFEEILKLNDIPYLVTVFPQERYIIYYPACPDNSVQSITQWLSYNIKYFKKVKHWDIGDLNPLDPKCTCKGLDENKKHQLTIHYYPIIRYVIIVYIAI